MSRYAATTSVTPEKSRAEIEATLKRYGADQFIGGWSGDTATIAFRIHGVYARLNIAMPKVADLAKVLDDRGRYVRTRTNTQAVAARDQAVRQRWRAMLLLIKAKLEAVELGMVTVEEAFLADLLIGNGQRFGDWARPQIRETYDHGIMPAALPGLPMPRVEVVEP